MEHVQPARPETKRAYVAPTLTVHGPVEEITLAAKFIGGMDGFTYQQTGIPIGS